MLEQQKTFGEALAEWMRASGVSAKRLAERTGYKSKTSIVRILREEGVHAGRERLLEQLRKQDLLDRRGIRFACAGAGDQPRRADAGAGGECACAACSWGRRASELSPSLTQALEPLRQARSARILLLNGCQRGTHGRTAPDPSPAARAYHGTLREPSIFPRSGQWRRSAPYSPSPAFPPTPAPSARCGRMARRRIAWPGHALLYCAGPRRRQRPIRSCSFPAATTARGYIRSRPPLACLTSCARILVEGDFQPAVGAYATQEGPESIVEAMRFCTELERGCNARTVKPDVCINEVPGAVLYAALRRWRRAALLSGLDGAANACAVGGVFLLPRSALSQRL